MGAQAGSRSWRADSPSPRLRRGAGARSAADHRRAPAPVEARLAPTGTRAHRRRPGARRRVRTHIAAHSRAPVTRHRDDPMREFLVQIDSPRHCSDAVKGSGIPLCRHRLHGWRSTNAREGLGNSVTRWWLKPWESEMNDLGRWSWGHRFTPRPVSVEPGVRNRSVHYGCSRREVTTNPSGDLSGNVLGAFELRRRDVLS